jgi:PAS domain S-box-containing protein
MLSHITEFLSGKNFSDSKSLPRNISATDTFSLLAGLLEQNSTALIIFHGPELVIEHLNVRAQQLFKLSRETSVKKSLKEVSCQLWNYFSNQAAEVFSTGKPVFLKSLKYQTNWEGIEQSAYFDLELRPVIKPDQAHEYLIAVITDVSDHQLSRIQFLSSEIQLRQQLNLITNAMPLPIAYLDARCNFCFVNKMFETWIGLEGKQIEGKDFSKVFGDHLFKSIQPFMEETLKGQLMEFKTELMINKVKHNVEGHLLPHFSPDHSVIGFYAILVDISERKKITAAASSLNLSENLSALSRSINEMSKTLEHISERLNVAKAKIKRVGDKNEKTQEVLKKWISDLRISETITARVKKSLEEWLSKRAA